MNLMIIIVYSLAYMEHVIDIEIISGNLLVNLDNASKIKKLKIEGFGSKRQKIQYFNISKIISTRLKLVYL